MSNIVNWSYYSSLHNKVTENDFPTAEALAEKSVALVVGKLRYDNITSDTFGYDVLKDCICNVIDKMADDAESAKGKGIAGVSNDGYTETYAVTNSEQLIAELNGSIRAWLSGTGLVGAY